MSTRTMIAVILIALGIVAFAYQGITVHTREHAADIGPVHVTTEKTRTLPLPPIVGAVAMVGGIAILIAGRSRA